MPSLHNLWKLKASLKLSSGYKGELFQGGRVKPLFSKGTPSARNTKPSVTVPATTPGGYQPSRNPFVPSFFSKFFSSIRAPPADHNPSTFDSSKHQALSATEAVSRVLATPSIHGPLLNCTYSALEGAREVSGSSLRELSETGLYLLTGQFPGGVPSQNDDRKVPKQVVASISSGPQNVWKEQRLCDRSTTTDTAGAVDTESFTHISKKIVVPDSRALVIKGIDELCEENEDSDSEGGECGCNTHLDWTRLDKATMHSSLGIRKSLHQSIAHYLLHSGEAVSAEENIHAKFMSSLKLAGTESPGLVVDGNNDFDYAKDRLKNLDNYTLSGSIACAVVPEKHFKVCGSEGVRNRSLRLLSGACCLPHPKKVKTGGEDAYFICSEEQVVGVADGVGGWADVGVDAGDYARELMLQSRIAVAQEPHGYIDPARVMLRAHAKTKCPGSSTACILALSDYGLQAANLGDSGFVLMRNGRTVFKSPVQQHQFNIPFQLESGGSDPPSAAEVFSLQVAAGDVLVAGTDGLFDNLYDNELMGVVIHSTRSGLDPQVTAQKIVALARERAEDRNRQTPFSTAAQEAGFRFYGGKMDDITVVVSYVTNTKSGFLNPFSKL